MLFTQEINRLLIGILAIFGIIAISASYWAIFGPDTILKREDNPRLVESEAQIARGSIYDRNDNLLVTSNRNAAGSVIRNYLYPEMASALGYFSLRYGVGGIEAAYNETLRGDDLLRNFSEQLIDQLLHHPRQGADIKLSLDLDIQREIVQAMGDHTGAAVMVYVPNGEILSLVSLPTYDPNVLDSNWENLTTDPGNPFFNRAIQGNYQPGGILQTPLVATALLADYSLDSEIENASRSLFIDDVELTCAVPLGERILTLREAYAFACPYPFQILAEQLGAPTLQAAFDTFRFSQPPTLAGFVTESDSASPANPMEINPATENLVQDALGQGELTVTPLEMAAITGAIVNDGNAPQVVTLLSTRPPNAATWIESLHPAGQTIPFLTANVARQLQDVMRNAIASGAAQNAGRTNIDIGGHAALAYSGNTSQAWFIGFATLSGRRGVAVAIVLEDSNDLGLAADIGGRALQAAHDALEVPLQ